MGESVETMKRRLEFAINERQQKVRELEQIRSQVKGVGVAGVLHSLLGDSTTHQLQLQQMQARTADINSQIRALDFEINTLRSALSSGSSTPGSITISPSTIGSITTGSSIAHRFTCPNCGVSRALSNENFEKIKKQRIGLCKNCGAPFKINVREKTGRWSFEPLRENPTFYIHSPLLDTDLAFTEIKMPDDVRENILNMAKQLEKGDEIGARGELENIYTTYPAQVSSILLSKGLYRFIEPFTVDCQRCGVGIPRARLGNCPICKDAVVQKNTAEDPIQILKLRLAKGEISKEEYEDLKKSVES